ncbi:PREDICTED: vesicle transport through interaction with t-SNAREs homolog 1A isoform X2 [Nicrophorus vespilloides]|uniref:Vesicle transport through interaction with t-SNAREs homolog 1A isoform X2 n=1 Tax=Nicrophorus vespilloides TaxID=110193 RepID=A0ABM1N1S9_NICVS|nr:PREDICTED: vesicle transport through interaction with t-SNAREs homolog 1A isoform X2 [Nicrophorus vespilloides]
MGSLFENYEQQYAVLTADITAQIGLLRASTTNRRQLISDIEKHVEEAQELLEQMDLEVREIEAAKKQRCRNKLECYRTELKRLTLEYIKARSFKQVGYESAEDVNDFRIGSDQKQRLLDNSERVERTGRKLDDGYRIVLETQEIGSQVLQNLHEQRETIQRSRNRLRETGEDLGQSSRLMNSMLMRAIQRKIVLYTVGVCFVVAIVIGLYLGFNKSN